jgi:nicotinamidase-related amidase
MATVRDGARSVLLVVDVQVGVMAGAWEAPRVIGNVARAVAAARGRGTPVVWVQHASEDLVPGSPQWQWVPELVPAADEPVVHKRFNSSFEQTSLEAELACAGATHIVLAGAATNWCVRATAYGALDRGYDLTLVSDAHTTASIALADGKTIEASGIVRELNIAMTWLSYPGRTTAAATTDELRFAAPDASSGSERRASSNEADR